jgi:hypothetical protein
MSLRIILAIVAVAGMSIFGLTSSIMFEDMVAAVNRRLPKDQQFAPLGWYWTKTHRVQTEYKRLYPDGPLLRKVRTLWFLMFACFLTCICVLLFFGR